MCNSAGNKGNWFWVWFCSKLFILLILEDVVPARFRILPQGVDKVELDDGGGDSSTLLLLALEDDNKFELLNLIEIVRLTSPIWIYTSFWKQMVVLPSSFGKQSVISSNHFGSMG